jgi:hypothetical protein
MERSIRINNCLFGKTRFWQGFPGENRLKSHRAASAANASGSLQTTLLKLPRPHDLWIPAFLIRGSPDRDLSFLVTYVVKLPTSKGLSFVQIGTKGT